MRSQTCLLLDMSLDFLVVEDDNDAYILDGLGVDSVLEADEDEMGDGHVGIWVYGDIRVRIRQGMVEGKSSSLCC